MVNYGYMWWIMPRTMPIHVGAFVAIGIFYDGPFVTAVATALH
jgi:hypothetical protein